MGTKANLQWESFAFPMTGKYQREPGVVLLGKLHYNIIKCEKQLIAYCMVVVMGSWEEIVTLPFGFVLEIIESSIWGRFQ